MGNGDGTHVLPIVGMNFDALPPGALPVYGFEAKWLWDDRSHPLQIFECPARIDEVLRSRLSKGALARARWFTWDATARRALEALAEETTPPR